MSDRVIQWLDSLDLPPCSCGEDEDALCPECARMLAVGRLRSRAPTWGEVRDSMASALHHRAEQLSEDARVAAMRNEPVAEAFARGVAISTYRRAAAMVGAWTPGVRRG